MKGNESVISDLQQALTMELTAVHQYLLHAEVLDDWGLNKLAGKMRTEMTEELGHAQKFLERIVFLEGEPDVQSVKSVARAQTLKDMFENDLADEHEARQFYTKAAQTAVAQGDVGSEQLFRETALDEEGHIDWLENQITLLGRLGEAGFHQIYADPMSAEA